MSAVPTWKLSLNADFRSLIAEACDRGDLTGDLVSLAEHDQTIDVFLDAQQLDTLHLVAIRHIAHSTWEPITAAQCASAIERLLQTEPTGKRQPPEAPKPLRQQSLLLLDELDPEA